MHAQMDSKLAEQLAPNGLTALGWFSMFSGPDEMQGKSAALIGNRGRAMWQRFSASDIATDGQPNPLERWTKAVMQPLTSIHNAHVLFPFLEGSERYWPFQQWAKVALGLQQSPPGLLIDPVYGLWHAFRAVLVFDQEFDVEETRQVAHPCYDCLDKPCLNTCPVDAITPTKYRVNACRQHLISQQGQQCSSTGCLARNACPVGREHAYSSAQQEFHMNAFGFSERESKKPHL